jgi:hypothetical protein
MTNVISCTHSENTKVETAANISNRAVVEHTISSIVDNPEEYVGKEFSISGHFRGWNGRCKGSPPVTRSDWMIEDDKSCLYVSGPIPKGFHAHAPDGQLVIITGVIKINKTSGVYIDITQ